MGGIFDCERLEVEFKEFQTLMSAADFWDNKEKAQETVGKVSNLKAILEPYRALAERTADFGALLELAQEEGDDSLFLSIIQKYFFIKQKAPFSPSQNAILLSVLIIIFCSY